MDNNYISFFLIINLPYYNISVFFILFLVC